MRPQGSIIGYLALLVLGGGFVLLGVGFAIAWLAWVLGLLTGSLPANLPGFSVFCVFAGGIVALYAFGQLGLKAPLGKVEYRDHPAVASTPPPQEAPRSCSTCGTPLDGTRPTGKLCRPCQSRSG